jgi:hypothetical protein
LDRAEGIALELVEYLTDASTVRRNTNPARLDGREQPTHWYPRHPWDKIASFSHAVTGDFAIVVVVWKEPSNVTSAIVIDAARFPNDLVIATDNTISRLELLFSESGWFQDRITVLTDSVTVVSSSRTPEA